jgi:hypothetical protein
LFKSSELTSAKTKLENMLQTNIAE